MVPDDSSVDSRKAGTLKRREGGVSVLGRRMKTPMFGMAITATDIVTFNVL